MSWAFAAVGKPKAVYDKACKELGEGKFEQPEQAIKENFLEMLKALASDSSSYAVKVTVFCSRATSEQEASCLLSIVCEPIYGFVE